MGAYNRDQQQTQFYKLKINKENETPYFYRQEKKNDVWVEAESFNAMKGQLKNINVKSYEWEGKTKQAMEMELTDIETGERMVISMGFNNMTRSLLNSLAGCDSIGVIELQAARWGKKGADKKYPTVFVTNNGQKTAWKFQMADIPQVEAIKNKKGETVSIDDTDANEFFKLAIQTDIIPKIHIAAEVKKEMEQPKSKKFGKQIVDVSEHIPDTDDGLGLPF